MAREKGESRSRAEGDEGWKGSAPRETGQKRTQTPYFAHHPDPRPKLWSCPIGLIEGALHTRGRVNYPSPIPQPPLSAEPPDGPHKAKVHDAASSHATHTPSRMRMGAGTGGRHWREGKKGVEGADQAVTKDHRLLPPPPPQHQIWRCSQRNQPAHMLHYWLTLIFACTQCSRRAPHFLLQDL